MNKHVIGALSGLFLLTALGFATAQTTVVVKPEQETVIREYVQKQAVAAVEIPGVEIKVGTKIPDTVELHTLDVPDVKYRYVVVGSQTVLVDPDTREIVHIIG